MIKLQELSYNGEIVLNIEVDENNGTIILMDKYKNSISLGAKGISLFSTRDINISSQDQINIEGVNIKINAKIGLAAQGNATAELSAAGQTTVKGAIVMIN